MGEPFNNAAILRFYGTDESLVWDRSNDTVIVTRTLLNSSAAEIERLRAVLELYSCPGIGRCPARRMKDGGCELAASGGTCGQDAHAALVDEQGAVTK